MFRGWGGVKENRDAISLNGKSNSPPCLSQERRGKDGATTIRSEQKATSKQKGRAQPPSMPRLNGPGATHLFPPAGFRRTQIRLNLRFAFVGCPVGWGTTPEDILHIQSCAALDEQSDHFLVAGGCSLMQRRRMGMTANRIVAVGIFTRVQQRAHDFDLA